MNGEQDSLPPGVHRLADDAGLIEHADGSASFVFLVQGHPWLVHVGFDGELVTAGPIDPAEIRRRGANGKE